MIKLISKIYFIYLLFFSFQILAEKNEVTDGVKDSSPIPNQTCTLLVDWVNSDFKDKTFNIRFSNTASKCLAENKKTYDKLTGPQKKSIIKTENLGEFYSEKFKYKLLKSYQDKYLNQCQSPNIDETKKRALQTRFYTSAVKIEAVNSNILDEIAYYDSVLPSPYDSSLMGINCKTSAFLEINSKCVEYKKQIKDCNENKSTRFENLINKTKEKLTKIVELEKAHSSCLTKTRFKYNGQPPKAQTNEKCKPFFQAVELIKDQIPWVRGEVFNSIAVKVKPSYRNNYQTEYDEKKMVQAVSDQLHKNRQALVRTFKTNEKSFECLISNNTNDSGCDFKKIRSQLASQPDVKVSDIFKENSKEDQEGILQLESDQCLIKYEDDLYQLNNTIQDVGYTVVLTAATLGIGWVSGLKVINSMSKLGRSLAIANGTFGAVTSGVNLKYTHQECTQESKLVIDLSAKLNLAKENVCSKEDSPLSQAQENETDCLLGALLSAPGILPFLGSTQGLMKIASEAASHSAKSTGNITAPIMQSATSTKKVSKIKLNSNTMQKRDFVPNNDLDGVNRIQYTNLMYKEKNIPHEIESKYPEIVNRSDQIKKVFTNYRNGNNGNPFFTSDKSAYISEANNLPVIKPTLKSLFQNISSSMTDLENWGRYSKNLYLDSVSWVKKNGTQLELMELKKGEVSRRSIIAVLFERAKVRGDNISIVRPHETGPLFFKRLSEGLVFDKAYFGSSDHGQLVHLIQLDYITPVLAQSTVSRIELHQFFNTSKGNMYWNYFFDGKNSFSFSQPESLGAVLSKVLPIKTAD